MKAQEAIVHDHVGRLLVCENQQIQVAIKIEVGHHEVDRGPSGARQRIWLRQALEFRGERW